MHAFVFIKFIFIRDNLQATICVHETRPNSRLAESGILHHYAPVDDYQATFKNSISNSRGVAEEERREAKFHARISRNFRQNRGT